MTGQQHLEAFIASKDNAREELERRAPGIGERAQNAVDQMNEKRENIDQDDDRDERDR